MKLEEKLVSLRKAKGLSQLQLAEMMKVSRQAISRWEVGTAVPSTDNLKYLSQFYNVSLEYLLQDDSTDPILPGEEGKKTSKKSGGKLVLVLIVIAAITIVLVCGIFWSRSSQEIVPMEKIEGIEVDTDNTNDFELLN